MFVLILYRRMSQNNREEIKNILQCHSNSVTFDRALFHRSVTISTLLVLDLVEVLLRRNMDPEYFPGTVGKLQPCEVCGRTFNPETLIRHEAICRKNAVKQRKTFDSQKQRSVPEAPKVKKNSSKSSIIQTASKGNWRQKHEEFIQTVRAARGVTKAIKEGKELPPPPPPTINPDYVQCPHCMRRFNQHAAERHIKFCADQHKRLETRVKAKTFETMKAAEKQVRRTAYRPPMPISGMRRTVDLSNGTSGYPNSASQVRGQQRVPKRNTSAARPQERCNNDFNNSRFSDKSTFDTALPGSAVVTTRTGLKARVLASNSSSDIESSEYDMPKRDRSRRNASKPTEYQGYYQPSIKTQAGRIGQASNKTRKYNWDFDFDSSSSDIVKQNGVRKVSRPRQQSSMNKNGGISTLSGHGGSKHMYEDSINDFLSKEYGSRYTNEYSRSGRHDGSTFDSPFADFTRDYSYRGQGEPAHLTNKDASFTSDGSRESSNGAKQSSRFCHECGTRYPVATAKFCCECGMKRICI